MSKPKERAARSRITVRTWDERRAAEGCAAVLDVICASSAKEESPLEIFDSRRQQPVDFDHLPESCVDPDPGTTTASSTTYFSSSSPSDLGEQEDTVGRGGAVAGLGEGLVAEGSLFHALPSGCYYYQSETTPAHLNVGLKESLGDNYISLHEGAEVSQRQAARSSSGASGGQQGFFSVVDMKDGVGGATTITTRAGGDNANDNRSCESSRDRVSPELSSYFPPEQHDTGAIRSQQTGPEPVVDNAAGNGGHSCEGICPVQIVQMDVEQSYRPSGTELQATVVPHSSINVTQQYLNEYHGVEKQSSRQSEVAQSLSHYCKGEFGDGTDHSDSGNDFPECHNPNLKLGSESIQENFQGFCRQLLSADGGIIAHSTGNSSNGAEASKTLTFAVIGTTEMVDGSLSKRASVEGKVSKQQTLTEPFSERLTNRKQHNVSNNLPQNKQRSCEAEAMAVIEQLDLSLSEALQDADGHNKDHRRKELSESDSQEDNLVEEIYVNNTSSHQMVSQNGVSCNGRAKINSKDPEIINRNVSDAQTNTDFTDVYIGVKRITHPAPTTAEGHVANVKLRDKSKLRDDRNRIYRVSWRSLCKNDSNTLPKVTVAKVEKKDNVNRYSTPIIDARPVTNISSDQKMNTLNDRKGRPRYQERAVDVDGLEPSRMRCSKSEPTTPASANNKRHTLPNSSRKATQQDAIMPVTPIIGVATKESKEILNNQTTFNGTSSNKSKEAALRQATSPNVADVDVHDGTTSGLESAVVASSSSVNGSIDPRKATHHTGHFVVVAIDFGTTFSGYAFSFTRDPENIHMMRKWEGGDPGVINQKTPTCLLLTPEGEFHSFGFTARDHFHNLDAQEAKTWLYFDKFKMTLHHNTTLNRDTKLPAANGKTLSALTIFGHALRYFKNHALIELSDQSATEILNEDVRWVITVPAIWRQPAKQFMRQAAYEAGIACPEYPDQLLIALEPEAASIYCRKLRMNQLIPEGPGVGRFSLVPPKVETNENTVPAIEDIEQGLLVDCGGGTVDITVHEMADRSGSLKELYKATGGPHGSVGVDLEFERLLNDIFGADFIEQFKLKRPAAYVELMTAFEARKRGASPYKNNPLNISLPFSFIDYYRKCKGSSVENAIKKHGNRDVRWSAQGMLRLEPDAMSLLFRPVVTHIVSHIGKVVANIESTTIRYLFLVGGFAESQILQNQIREVFGSRFRVVIPQGVSLAILRGAVLYGLDPTIVCVRRSRMTYGVGVLNRFIPNIHPREKCVRRDKEEWCADVFDKFVLTDQSVGLGDTILRSYTPANSGQKQIILHIYCTENDQARFVTDPGVKRCGTLNLDLTDTQFVEMPKRREIQMRMIFGDTEIKVSALDVVTQKFVRAEIDFLNL